MGSNDFGEGRPQAASYVKIILFARTIVLLRLTRHTSVKSRVPPSMAVASGLLRKDYPVRPVEKRSCIFDTPAVHGGRKRPRT